MHGKHEEQSSIVLVLGTILLKHVLCFCFIMLNRYQDLDLEKTVLKRKHLKVSDGKSLTSFKLNRHHLVDNCHLQHML